VATFRIEGGRPLAGEVIPSGNKNAALPLLAACLLTDQPVTLHNVPEIGDVQAMRHLLEGLGTGRCGRTRCGAQTSIPRSAG